MKNQESKSKHETVEQPSGEGLSSSVLFGRLLFIYALNGVVKCFSADEIRPLESAMIGIGWKHTATIDPARWIEALANNGGEPSDMLDELQFCPPNVKVHTPLPARTSSETGVKP